jgi:hypothetical protein
MNINLQHHNLLGNQISPKSEDFCIWRIMIHFVGISTVVCGSFWGLNKFKMVTIVMVTKVQNGRQIQKSSDLGEIWFPSRL